MERSLEQLYVIKFCVWLRKNATDTYEMLQEVFKEKYAFRDFNAEDDTRPKRKAGKRSPTSAAVLDAQRQTEPLKTSSVCARYWVQMIS